MRTNLWSLLMGSVLLSFALVAYGQGAGTSEAPANQPNNGVSPFYGSFGTDVPIEVPPYHGLEPSLKLVYGSSGAQVGYLGQGWDLGGFSTLERVGPWGRGAPTYTASDSYVFDGNELYPCQVGSISPSCTTGGTHSTRLESYTRIQYVAASDEWRIWHKNGTRAILKAIHGQLLTFKWGVSEVRDTHNNVVNYDWETNVFGCCWARPKAVRYNGTIINVFWDNAVDLWVQPVRGIGNGGLETIWGRVKTIEVRVGANRARAYKLGYGLSEQTRAWRLTSVAQYGKDAVLDVSGTVTGGSSLPAMQLTYLPEGGFVYGGDRSSPTCISATVLYVSSVLGDFNGDGYMDAACTDLTTPSPAVAGPYPVFPNVTILWGGPNGWVGMNTSNIPACRWVVHAYPYGYQQPPLVYYKNGRMTAMDVNGDGRSDLVCLRGRQELQVFSADITAHLSQPGTGPAASNNFVLSSLGSVSTPLPMSDFFVDPADLNGDGRQVPIVRTLTYNNTTGQYQTGIWIGAASWSNSWCTTATASAKLHVGDFNGDGRDDLACHTGGQIRTALSNGTTFVASAGVWSASYCSGGTLVIGDVNGDGKSDLICHEADNNVTTAISPGDGVVFVTAGDGPWCQKSGGRVVAGDFNGDGKTDVMCHVKASPQPIIGLSNGRTFAAGRQVTLPFAYCGSAGQVLFAADMNGDGFDEPVCTVQQRSSGESVPHTVAYVPNQAVVGHQSLSRLKNGLGGETLVSYKSSTAYANSYLPVGMKLQVVSQITMNDGRGGASVNNYSYVGGLYSDAERRFLGFRYVNTTLDAAGNFAETYYLQRVGSISKPEYSFLRNAAGAYWGQSQYEYCEDGRRSTDGSVCGVLHGAPFTSLLISRTDSECNLQATCRGKLEQYAYDQYANVTTRYEHGASDVVGDERTTVRGFYPNTAAFIVGREAFSNIYTGIGATALVKQTLLQYDGAAAYTTPPTKGDVTTKRHLKDDGSFVTLTYAYDAYGNEISHTNALGAITRVAWDPTYNLYAVRSTDALGRASTNAWDFTLGRMTNQIDVNLSPVTYSHDAFGRPLQRTYPGGGFARYSYLNWGDPLNQRTRESISDGSVDGIWTDTYFDGLKRNWKIVREGGRTQLTEYNEASSRVRRQSLWYLAGATPSYLTYLYDGAQRPTETRHPDGAVVRQTYANGKVKLTDENGNWTERYYDGLGRMTRVDERNNAAALTHTTTYQYDTNDNLLRVTAANGAVTTNTWDRLGRKMTFCEPNRGCWAYTYDAAGQILSSRNARGQTINYGYDALGRRTNETKPDGTVTYRYDELGRGFSLSGAPTTIVFPNGEKRLSYDWQGRITNETQCLYADCRTFLRTFDLAQRLSSLTYPDAELVTYGYNPDGTLANVSGYVNSFVYNAAGQMTSITFANGVVQNHTYNNNRQWLTTSTVLNGTTTLFQSAYAYDPGARVTSVTSTTNPGRAQTYGYDGLNRLTSVVGAQAQTLAYDAVGNMTQNSSLGAYSYDAAKRNAVRTAGTRAYAYDLDGNMLSGDGRTLTWSSDSRLRTVTAGGVLRTYDYDAAGQRVAETEPGGRTRYYNGMAELLPTGQLVKYIAAGTLPIARRIATGEKFYYHGDRLGSIALITDGLGVVRNRYDYKAFGQKLTVATTAPITDKRGFTGHSDVAGTGLIYMNARWYDPMLGRFLSPDSLVPDPSNPQALNRYSYAFNNPISNVDPTGHAPVVATMMVAASVTATAMVAAAPYLAIMGMATTIAGNITKNRMLSTVGAIMAGFGGGVGLPGGFGGMAGGLLGAASAGLSSPLSPLDSNTAMAIGWAYTAYSLGVRAFVPTPLNVDGAHQAVAADKVSDPQAAEKAKIFEARMTFRAAIFEAEINKAKLAMESGGIDKGSINGFVSNFTRATGVSQEAAMTYALTEMGGMIGPGSSTFTTMLHSTLGSLAPVWRHAVVHDAFGSIYSQFGWGWGYLYSTGGVGLLSAGNPLSGQVSGIAIGFTGGYSGGAQITTDLVRRSRGE